MLRVIRALHDDLHATGERLMDDAMHENATAVADGLHRLADISEQLIDQLYGLIRARSPN